MVPVKSWICYLNSNELDSQSKKSNKTSSEEKKASVKRQASEISEVLLVTWDIIY